MRLLYKIIFLLVLVFPMGLSAQGDKEKLEALRISFISKKLELSVSESEKFWPIYNEYNDKLEAYRKSIRQNYMRRGENISDKDAEEIYAQDLQYRQAELDLYKQYSEKMKAVIGVKKLVKLRAAEFEWRKIVLEKAKGG